MKHHKLIINLQNNNFVDVWIQNLLEDIDLKKATESLSSIESIRANQFKFEEDKNRFTAAHFFLRKTLSNYCGTEPGKIEITQEKNQKPILKKDCNPDKIYFNLSYRENFSLLAISNIECIGIDIERHRHIENIDDFSDNFFSKKERAFMNDLSSEEKQQCFFKLWTRKEAYIKAIGKGLSFPLQSFSVINSKGDPLLSLPQYDKEEDFWKIVEIDTPIGFSGALAVRLF
jgi:4'-phosphopantetheinyl transferase